MTSRLPELGHIAMDRVMVAFAQARGAARHRIFASLTPLRFRDGAQETVRRGRRMRLQRVVGLDGREALYILRFYLPRFLDLPFREKISTVLHELWHIHPSFNGDIRRFGGRCYAHSGSQKRYDAAMDQLTEKWLGLEPPREVYEFLEHDYQTLLSRHGSVFGHRIAHPRFIPVDSDETAGPSRR